MTDTSTTDLRAQLIDRFWETIPPVWHRVRTHIHALAGQHHDLSAEQFHILRHIHKGADSVSQLAEVKGISRPAVSQAVNGLVERGLVVRSQEAQDRRYVHLKLTETGRSVLDSVFSGTRDWMCEQFASLNDAEIDQVLTGLALLKRGMAE